MNADDWWHLRTPLGIPGSGRVRYGAAAALLRAGLIGHAQLEVFREAAAHDSRDTTPILAERGLPPIPDAGSGPDATWPADPQAVAGAVEALARSLDTCLAGADHNGHAEVARAVGQRSGPPLPVATRPNPVVSRWLDGALAAMRAQMPALALSVARAAPHLCWTSYDAYPPEQIGADFASSHAFAPVIGFAPDQDAPYFADDVDMGLFLMAPHLLYRDHCHLAPELYLPLTGPHGWRFGTDDPLVWLPAGQPVWNPPWQVHLTKVGAVPFLAIYVWTRDNLSPARIVPASDWAKLEKMQP